MPSFETIMQTKQPEFKTLALPCPQATKAIDNRTVTTLFSVAGVRDSYDDVVLPGAFQQTIAQRGSKILHLWQHDFTAPPIGVVKDIREVSRDDLPDEVREEYPEATGGAEAVTEFIDSFRAEEVLTALKAGSPLQASFGYDPVRMSFGEKDGARVRYLEEIRLWEVSTCLFGANPAARGAKALLQPLEILVDQLLIHLQDVKAGRRNATTDQERINTIATLAIELGATSAKMIEDEPQEDTEQDNEKSRADMPTLPAAPSLTTLNAKLRLLNLSTVGASQSWT